MKIGSAKKKNSLSDKPRKAIFKLLVKDEQDVVRDNAIRVNSPETAEASSEPSINQSKATISLSPIPSSAVEENITHQERFENASSVDLDGLSSRGDKAQGGVHETRRQSQASLAKRTLKEGGVQLRDWLWTLKAPLFLLGAIALVPKIVLGWVLVILVKPVTSWIYNYCPKSWKATFHRSIPERFRNSPFLQDLSEGADQGLPFILFWLYIFCIPFAACWIVVHWIKGFLPERPRTFEDSNEKIVFAQNRNSDRSSSENNFYFSRVFGIVFLAFFALGIPAFCSFAVYENLGIEKKIKSHQVSPVVSRLMRTKNAPPASKPTLGIATRLAIQKKNNDQSTKFGTAVTGYHSNRLPLQSLGIEQNKDSTFFIHFYLASLACAVCILFFRTWFLFPLNFLTDEHDLELTTYGIKKKAFKGWFLSFLTFNKFSIAGGPDSLKWDRIKSVARPARRLRKAPSTTRNGIQQKLADL